MRASCAISSAVVKKDVLTPCGSVYYVSPRFAQLHEFTFRAVQAASFARHFAPPSSPTIGSAPCWTTAPSSQHAVIVVSLRVASAMNACRLSARSVMKYYVAKFTLEALAVSAASAVASSRPMVALLSRSGGGEPYRRWDLVVAKGEGK